MFLFYFYWPKIFVMFLFYFIIDCKGWSCDAIDCAAGDAWLGCAQRNQRSNIDQNWSRPWTQWGKVCTSFQSWEDITNAGEVRRKCKFIHELLMTSSSLLYIFVFSWNNTKQDSLVLKYWVRPLNHKDSDMKNHEWKSKAVVLHDPQ